MTGWSLRRSLHLVNHWLDGRLVESLDLRRLVNIDRCTHRVGLQEDRLALSIMTRMIRVKVGSVGGIRDLRLEMDTRVGLLDVARHVVGSWSLDEDVLAGISSDVSVRVSERLTRSRESGSRKVAILVQIALAGVMGVERLSSRGDWGGVVVRLNARNARVGIGGGRIGGCCVLRTRLLGRTAVGGLSSSRSGLVTGHLTVT
jgi:hypothetical protein